MMMPTALRVSARELGQVACVMLVMLAALSPQPASAADAAPIAYVVAQRGAAVSLRSAGSAETVARALYLGAALYKGDHVITTAQSRVRIEFADGSVLAVGPGTEVALAAFTTDGEGRGLQSILSLILGIVRATLPGPQREQEFSIRSRAAVASVRSTDFVVEAQPEKTAVFAVEGAVAVMATGADARVVLEPGFGTDVPVGGPPSPPKRWGPPRVADVIARTRVP